MTGHDLDQALSEARAIIASDTAMMLRRCYQGDDPERIVYAETALDVLPTLVAEVKSLRAKLAAVQEWAMVSEIAAPPLDWAALGRALAAEQDEPKREQS